MFDKTYYSGLGYGINDNTQNPYVVHDLALSRTFETNCSFRF